MTRPRPHIPILTKVLVARRQLIDLGVRMVKERTQSLTVFHEEQIEMLKAVWQVPAVQLDHDPALILRDFDPQTGKYTPDANDRRYLFYRGDAEHLQKTTGRKPGAERTVTTKGSDIGLKSKFARLEGRTKKRPKTKIPARQNPWPKRKMGR